MTILLVCVGCAVPEAKQTIPDECPDLGLLVTKAVVTDTLDPYGRPITSDNEFSVSGRAIYLVFSLSDDMCCRTLNVRWFSEGKPDPIQIDDNIHSQFPVTLSLKANGNGYVPGVYTVKIYIDFWEKISIPFSVHI